MELSVNQEKDQAYLRIKGVIDEPGAEELKQGFQELDLQSVKEVTLDFADVVHIGSAGVGKLLVLHKELVAAGGTVRIVNMPEPIYNLFLILKLENLFSFSKADKSQAGEQRG